MDIYLLKALHIIFIVTWFAGLFYIVRLFIYHAEANDKIEPEKSILIKQYKIMQFRLWYIITWPSFILTMILGPWLLIQHHLEYLTLEYIQKNDIWMYIKLGFVLILAIYHLITHKIYRQLQKDEVTWNSMKLRLWNEVATVLLVVIVFLVVYQRLNFYKGVIAFFAMVILLMLATKLYKKMREKNDKKLK